MKLIYFTSIVTLAAGSCDQGEWRYPEECSDTDCQYMAKWTKAGDSIKVSVQGRSEFSKEWIGIGFSVNPFMVSRF
jgi:hypothetical protein